MKTETQEEFTIVTAIATLTCLYNIKLATAELTDSEKNMH